MSRAGAGVDQGTRRMSRDFILILGGGVVSLLTTLVVLFVSDYIYRRDELLYRKALPPPIVIPQPQSDTAAASVTIHETDTASQKPMSPTAKVESEAKDELKARPIF